MRRLTKAAGAWVLAVGAWTAACGPPAVDRAEPEDRRRPKVLVIGLDGVRVDVLRAARTPVIDGLIEQGTFSDSATTGHPTVSGPGWSSMLIGVWPEKHRVTGNDFTGNAYQDYPDFLTRLEGLAPELGTLAVLDWPPLGEAVDGGPLVSDRVDRKVLLQGREEDDGYREADSLAVEEAARELSGGDWDAAFVYLGNIDVVGHANGSLSDEYRAAIEQADRQVGRILEAVRSRPGYGSEDWLVLMSTDHGRSDDGSHGGESQQERTIFYLASGPSAVKGKPAVAPHIVDVAVTAMTHLGIRIEPEWKLDGRVVGLQSHGD